MGSPSVAVDVPAPKLEDLADYFQQIKYIGLKNGVHPQEVDDFVGKVVLDFIDKDYLSIYDPQKAPFASFMRAFAQRRAMSTRDKSIRADRTEQKGHFSDSYEDGDPSALRAPADPVDVFTQWEDSDKLEAVLDQLHEIPPYETAPYQVSTRDVVGRREITRTYTVTVERSLFTLLQFLLKGLSMREIALIYGRSLGTVANMVAALRRNPIILHALIPADDLD
jgi:DNA-directed RNA polymerase specialized sigma24 family protein